MIESNKSIRIGLMNGDNTKLRSGPKVFMDRLTNELNRRDIFSEKDFNVWLNLSFREIPSYVTEETPVVSRFDGVWSLQAIPNRFGILPANLRNRLNNSIMQYANRIIVTNFDRSSAIIYQSQFSKKMVEKYISDENKKHEVIYNGVDLSSFSPSVKKNDTGTLNIVVSHKLWPTKRFDQIPLVIKELVKLGLDVNVNVLGDGVRNPQFFFQDTLSRFKKIVDRLALTENFTFHGHISPESLPEFYRSNDLMLNLSFSDPCPNVVIEAMACGLPVIAPAHGGIAELGIPELLIDEKIDELEIYPFWDYFALPKINPMIYAEKILDVVISLERFKEQSREIAEKKYNIESITSKYIGFISSLL